MKKKKDFQLYTGMWLIATLFLLTLLWQNVGDAREVNYSGIVRGATQKLVKEELAGHPDDELVNYIDGVIYDLQTGEGEYNLTRNRNKQYQRLLSDLNIIWGKIKAEVPKVRVDQGSSGQIYELSEQHFKLADRMVQCAEEYSGRKLTICMGLYCICLILSISFFAVSNKRNQREIEKSLSYDGLTGCLSRGGFEREAAALLHKYQNTKFIIVEFDVDNFKSINKTYGYAQGDQLLKTLSAAVMEWKGSKTICARINADDFVLMCEQGDTMIQELTDLLEQTAIEQKALLLLGDISFTLGAYQIDDNHELIKSIMDKANTAHKNAKLHDQKSFLWYDENLIKKIELAIKYKEQMQQGLKNEEFQLFLQPKIELANMDVIGAEALVRWNMPDRGLVYPDEYIYLFEKNGSIIKLDYYMLEKTCSYLRTQLDQELLAVTVSVNFSRVTLYNENFYESFLGIVDHFNLPHHYIEVEITESAFNEITDNVLHTIQLLKDAGFGISMDDFGAGYSNLNLLSRLPIQIIKLDREFLRNISHNSSVRGIISCVVDMAHAMGLKVVCEGVEQAEHVHFLRNIGCDYAQGYYFSKPVTLSEFNQRYDSSMIENIPMSLLDVVSGNTSVSLEINQSKEPDFGEILLQTYPGFVSLRNEKHEIVYLNENFKNWIRRYTDVSPLGKTNVELAAMVPDNVAATFLQCHDGSLELQKQSENKLGLKKIIEFKGASEKDEPTQYFDVLKYWVKLNKVPFIFTIAYDITGLYVENIRNLQSSMTDSLTGAGNRRYLQSEIALYYGHYAAAFDLDNFKMINDQEGHITGDKILREFVLFIEEHVPHIITLIRLGGDEFFVIFEKGVTEKYIGESLKKVRALYMDTYSMYNYLSFSAGVDIIGSDMDETLRRLDQRMYEDKNRET